MRSGFAFGVAFFAILLTGPTTSRASDHIDGLKTAADIGADLTDLFTFTSPRDPNKLVLIMDVHGLAMSRSRFSNAVDYTFRIRPIADARTLLPSNDRGKEQSIVCQFSGGFIALDPKQTATCTFNLGGSPETISFETRSDQFRAGGMGESGDIKVFAGVRSDPWFLDLGRTLAYNAGKPVEQTSGLNGLWGQNVLSIVVEVDKRRLAGPLLAVTAQTVRK
jgi:hypothetical protein